MEAPSTFAERTVPSAILAVMTGLAKGVPSVLVTLTTWALVSISPSDEITTPEPAAMGLGVPVEPSEISMAATAGSTFASNGWMSLLDDAATDLPSEVVT